MGHVWTAPWQGLSDVSAALVGCTVEVQGRLSELLDAAGAPHPFRKRSTGGGRVVAGGGLEPPTSGL